jgi:ABC-type multidrug transport system ATPase subunit
MAVYEELSALENLQFFSRLRGLDVNKETLAQLLQDLGLRPADLRRPVGEFSSGMMQRVKLAQALVHKPAVLLLDEPSSNLDAQGHETLSQLLAKEKARCAVVVATNDPREVAWGDEILELAS